MLLVKLIQGLMLPGFLALVWLLVIRGKPAWLAKRARSKPFYPFRRWDWTEMPTNWRGALVWCCIYTLAFGCVTTWLMLSHGASGWAVASVSGLMCLHFMVLSVRIIAKKVALGSPH